MTFEIRKISVSEINKELSSIKTSKDTGQDHISSKLLKDSSEVIAESLTNLLNKSIEKDIFPDDSKFQGCLHISYSFKETIKGDSKDECSNYTDQYLLYL